MKHIPEDRLAQIGDPMLPLSASMPRFEEVQAMVDEIWDYRVRVQWWTRAAPIYAGVAVAITIVAVVLR